MYSVNHQNASRGFTLVEMSIVLVIIGLIIGGILKGQEIIASARQKATINQVNAVRAATNTYFDRYRALPGDDPNAANIDANLTTTQDGNGIVGTAATSIATLGSNDGSVGENYGFFNDLIAAGLLNGGQVTNGVPTTVLFGSTALPASPITGAGMTVIYGPHAGTGTGTTKTTHWVRIHKKIAAPAASISPRTMANIDNQIDDGLPGNGGVRTGVTAGATACDNTGAYNALDDIKCIPLFEITQ